MRKENWKIIIFEEDEKPPWADVVLQIVEILGPIIGVIFLYFITLEDLTPINAIFGLAALALGFAAYLIATIIRNGQINLIYLFIIVIFMVFAVVVLYIMKSLIQIT
ncbi:hypothetical protein LCGC14_0832950 [marine sediment metagenome]|uniref:Uncharacterized protein n=1 Tax=marine sediment metagenome TaxID=412755 RepID=A0A0F9Q0L5_9ZZZZ